MSVLLGTRRIDKTTVSVTIRTTPTVGVVGVASFLSTVNLNGGSVISTNFRYSLDGINYTSPQPLTNPNLAALTFNERDTVIFEVLFTHTEEVEILSVEFTNTDLSPGYTDSIFQKTIFSDFFTQDSLELLEWYLNLLEKLYYQGILPPYIRRVSETNNSDRDFIEFWRSISMFFGYFVIYSRKYGNFWEDRGLLGEYVVQRGLAIQTVNSIDHLKNLLSNFYREIAKRGTVMVLDGGQFQFDFNPGSDIYGELLRLIEYQPKDDFLFYFHQAGEWGWCMRGSSPLYRGVGRREGTQKYNELEPEESIVVNPETTYELNFKIKTDTGFKISFECKDVGGAVVDLFSSLDGSIANVINVQTPYRSDKYLYYKVILYFSGKTPSLLDKLYQNGGYNLILNSQASTIKWTFNYLGGTEEVEEVFFSPSFTAYSHGIVQVKDWVSVWLTDNSHSL